jgi:MFS family permease
MAMKAGADSRDLVPPLLRNRVFRRYWGASTVSMFGDQVSSVAVPLTAVLVLHAKPYEMGYLTALEWLPSLLFGLHAGAWLDRRGKRRNAMIVADLGRAAGFATIPLCYAFHVLTLAQMCVVTFVCGALSVLFTVSDGTLFVSIVEPEEYVDGQSLIYGSRALSFLGGPSVGGLLVQALSGPYAVVVDALSFLGSASQLRSIRPVEPPAADDGDGLTVGLRFIARSPIIRASLVGVAVINFFNLMFEALFMLYAVRALGVSAGLLGVVIGAGAIGGILGSVLCKWLTSRLGAGLVYVAGCFVFTMPLALVPLASPTHRMLMLLMLFASCFASGFGVMVLDISIASISGVVIPDTLRSRVSGAYQAINYGTRPAGALLGGLLGTALGLRPALWVAVAGGVFGSILLLPSPLPQFRMPTLNGRASTIPRAGQEEAASVRDDGSHANDRSRGALLDGRARRGTGDGPVGQAQGRPLRQAAQGCGQGTDRGHGRRGDRRAGAVARTAGGAGASRRGWRRGGPPGE